MDLPGEGLRQVAYFQSWNRTIYAVRMIDGSEVWHFDADAQPGAAFENAASGHVERVDDRDVLFMPAGETLYALDAATGQEIWRFVAGTGCVDANGDPPGLCAFDGERNQVESSPIVANGNVVFGMDINDVVGGKGGVYGVDAREGTLAWYYDPESTATCTPNAGDAVRQFDGYHSAAELGLPPDFFTTRAGCDFPRNGNGCGNVWSSFAYDPDLELLFSASSNCDTPLDPSTCANPNDPSTCDPFPMPPGDEAIFALDASSGELAWVWRPRAFDNDDLAFGAVPNLFEIEVEVPQGGPLTPVGVVGVGGKDGTYYVLDRSGVNQTTGVAWDDDPASHLPADLPYWTTQVVGGGDIGGIIATAAVDADAERIFFSTAPGESGPNAPPGPPQAPTIHALDMHTGDVVWQDVQGIISSFGPTSAIPGVAFFGSVPFALLRYWETLGDSGTKLGQIDFNNFALASGPAVIDGTVLIGEGIGTRSQNGSSPGDFTADLPSDLNALCVAGTAGCAACNNGVDDDGDGSTDFEFDDGCVSAADASEILGDLDYDAFVGERDRQRFLGAFGRSIGQPGFVDAADFDRDGIVGLEDYQTWLAALDDFENQQLQPVWQPSCGLLGIEPALLLCLA
ncbi:MAG: PQQ-binding-like beta-propeller repeat protein, partial [Thermoanaerobaculia bacterium]|nr:PQQ-binding-like beta-propeller repeat protein [Thermoanaerobaculia bacterium]